MWFAIFQAFAIKRLRLGVRLAFAEAGQAEAQVQA
jgi:hypothetical protein